MLKNHDFPVRHSEQLTEGVRGYKGLGGEGVTFHMGKGKEMQ